jgi:hypothetical protein
VSKTLTHRISRLDNRSTAIYWTIIATLVSGVALVIFSGYLSSFDSYASSVWSQIESENPLHGSFGPLDDNGKEQFHQYLTHENNIVAAAIAQIGAHAESGQGGEPVRDNLAGVHN